VNVQLLVFPTASVAVAVTVVVPTGNTEPEATLVETFAVPQLSVAVGAEKVTGIDVSVVFSGRFTTMFAGHAMTGAVESITVMVWFALAVLPAASVAVNVLVMTNGLAADPRPPLVVCETVTVGVAQLSEAVA